MLPLGSKFEKYNVSFHFYADDIEIYIFLTDDTPSSLHCFLDRMREVKGWLSSNSLTKKITEIIVFVSHIPRGQFADIFVPFATSLSDTVCNLGVLLDSSFKLVKQVSSVVQSSFYQLRQISKAKHYIPQMDNFSIPLLLQD